MKTYKLNSTSVEPQSAAPARPVLFIGLDVHNDSIAISLAPSGSTEVRRWGILGGTLNTCSGFSSKSNPRIPRPRSSSVTRRGRAGFRSCGSSVEAAHHYRVPARVLWHLLKFKEPFNPQVFAQEEEKMKRKKLARLQNMAASLNYQLVPQP